MQLDVYDTYAKDEKGKLIHFDVFVEKGAEANKAYQYALDYLESLDLKGGYNLDQSQCKFCHTQIANPKIKDVVEKDGYYILKL